VLALALGTQKTCRGKTPNAGCVTVSLTRGFISFSLTLVRDPIQLEELPELDHSSLAHRGLQRGKATLQGT